MGRDCKSRPNRGWRLILDSSRGAAENMAVDEAILHACAEGSAPPTIRIYSWDRGSISLGCLQTITPDTFDLDFCRSEGIDVVRRITGGRAVLHGSDVTFSVALRESDLPTGSSSVPASHGWLMSGIVTGLRLLDIDASVGPERTMASSEMNADCFAHIAGCDVRVGRKKAVGSAQVRRLGALLEQGSIPYAIPGFDANRVFGRTGRSISADDIPLAGHSFRSIEQALATGFADLLQGDLNMGVLTSQEMEEAVELATEKYSSEEWTRRSAASL